MTKSIVYRLDPEDVIRSDDENLPFVEIQTCLANDIAENLAETYDEDLEKAVFSDGLACRVLRPGQKKWLSGKIRFVLELELDPDPDQEEDDSTETDQSDSPLDEIRKLAES